MLERIRKEVPKSPGCYLYYNVNGEVIYVGKAKNLRNRMQSYFNKSHEMKTQKLVSEIVDFNFFITTSESESLILERNLIRKYSPRYNIMLKDDKNYPYILVTSENYSRILKVRDKKIKGEYFGPFPNATFVNDSIELINKNSKIRICKNVPDKECLYYHLGQCYGPCIDNNIELEKESKDYVLSLLRNNMKGLSKLALKKMNEKVETMDFEQAAKYRDIVNEIKQNNKKQAMQLNNGKSFDVISYYKDKNWVSISIVSVVDGIVNNVNSSLHPYYDDYTSVIISYLHEYYNSNVSKLMLIDDKELSKIVSNVFVSELIISHLTEYRTLEEMAFDNAKVYYKNNVDKITKLLYDNKASGFNELQKIANDKLNIIEVFDISHNQGDSQVAGKVVYIDGKRNPKLYRKYKIKQAAKRDEYGSMKEVLERRILRLIKDGNTPPNLIILDGGKGQVKIGLEILEKYGYEEKIKLLGLVKDDNHITRGMVNKNMDVFELDTNTNLYKFLFQLQEEVHRYAIDYHNTSQKNSYIISELDNIQGVGMQRKRLLIDKFNDIETIAKTSIDDLVSIGIPKQIAYNIHTYFNQKNIS